MPYTERYRGMLGSALGSAMLGAGAGPGPVGAALLLLGNSRHGSELAAKLGCAETSEAGPVTASTLRPGAGPDPVALRPKGPK